LGELKQKKQGSKLKRAKVVVKQLYIELKSHVDFPLAIYANICAKMCAVINQ
jgi:hypothetical protein